MADLRSHERHTPAALTYVSVGNGGNGGILLNLSEAGCALQLVAPPHLNTSIELELDLGSGYEPVHATGMAVWVDDTGCTGIRFTNLPETSRSSLKRWLEATREPEAEAQPAENPMAEIEALFAEASAELGLEGSSEEEDSFETRLNQLSTGAGLVALAEECRVRSGAAASAIALLSGREMTCRASSGTGAPPAGARLDIASEKSFTAQCVNTGKVLKCSDATVDPRVNAAVCQRLGIRSVTAIPLMEGKRAVGVLEVFSPEREAFDDECVASLRKLAKVCLAFARARGELADGSDEAVAKPATAQPSVITAQHSATAPSGESQAKMSAAAQKAMAAVSAVAAMSPAPTTSSAPSRAGSTAPAEAARPAKQSAYAPDPTPYIAPTKNEPELEVLAGATESAIPAAKEPAYAPAPTPYIPPSSFKKEPEIEVLAGQVEAPPEPKAAPITPPEPTPAKFARSLSEAAAAPARALEKPGATSVNAPLVPERPERFAPESAPVTKLDEELTSLADVIESPPKSAPPSLAIAPPNPIASSPASASERTITPEKPKSAWAKPARSTPPRPTISPKPLRDYAVQRTVRREVSNDLPSFAAPRAPITPAGARIVLFAAAAVVLAAVIVIGGWRIFRSGDAQTASASQPTTPATSTADSRPGVSALQPTSAPQPTASASSSDNKPTASISKPPTESQKTPASDSADSNDTPAVELQPVMTLAPGQQQAKQQPVAPEVAPPAVATSAGGSGTLQALMSNEPTRTVSVAAPMSATASGPLRVSSAALDSRLIRRVEPRYPDIARRSGMNGSVTLRLLIGPDGGVRQVRVLDGPAVLASAARDAVAQWRYRPYLVDGTPTEVETDMIIRFTARR